MRDASASLRPFARAFARIGLLSFGGPAAQIATMHRILVDELGWIDNQRFLHALAFCMALPGPEAMQLATWCGWALRGWRGALIAGLLFILPGLVVMLGLSALYATFHTLPLMAHLFLGLKAAVLVLVAQALARLAKKALPKPASWAMALAAFVALFTLNLPFPLLVLGAGLIGCLAQGAFGPFAAPPPAASAAPQNGWRRAAGIAGLWSIIWLAPLLLVTLLFGETSLWTQIGAFFGKVALVAFGGAYAILAYVAQAAVQQMHWLSAPQMLDGLALAETTPGPLILVLTYVGFIAGFQQPAPFSPLFGGLLGGMLASWMSFAPCFLWVLLGAPYVERARGVVRLNSALAAIMAAMVGVILNLAVWFAFHALFAADQTLHLGPLSLLWPDGTTFRPLVAAIAGVAALLLWRGAGLPLTLAACALLGLLAGWLGFAGG